ncbi:MAG: hypothetical protein ACHQ0J_13560 [Candidatus Dormibacterales bacterium]
MESRATSVMMSVAIAILLLTDALYLALIFSQQERPSVDTVSVGFIAAYMLLMAALLAASLSSHPRVVVARPLLRGAPAGGLLLLGTLAAFSIGLPLLAAAALAIIGTVRSVPRPRWRPPAALGALAAVAGVVVLVAGIDVTQRVIICPASGVAAGSGSGLVSGPYHYECSNGVLTFRAG